MILSPLQNSALLLGGQWLQKRPRITQKFGLNPQIYKQFGLKGHNGIDFGCPVGTFLYAPFEGVVHETGDQGGKGYGKFIRLRKDNLEFILAHLSSIGVVRGQTVYLGERIGFTGNTGFSFGPHLHIGMRRLLDGVLQNTDNGYAGYVDFLDLMVTWKGGFLRNNL